MPHKNLPHGDWLTLVNLPLETTEQDIQDFVMNRTGIALPSSHIQVNDLLPGKTTASAIVCFDKHLVKELVEWAFHEDKLGGREVRYLMPDRNSFGGRR